MARYHTTAEGNIPFTAEEETVRDIEEAVAISPSLMYDKKEEEIIKEFDNAVQTSLGKYTSLEIDSWYKQESEARAWVADNASNTPLLDAMVTARGTTMGVLTSQITAKANSFEIVYGGILGKKQALLDDLYTININDADALTQIAAITW